MRRSLLGRVAVAGLSAFLLNAGTASAAEHIYEDSFGNLIVQSPSGYKRIVVGKGYLAADLGHDGDEPARVRGERVIYGDASFGSRAEQRRWWRQARRLRDPDCNRQPVLLHGRSYMYGLPDNVVPVPAGLCR